MLFRFLHKYNFQIFSVLLQVWCQTEQLDWAVITGFRPVQNCTSASSDSQDVASIKHVTCQFISWWKLRHTSCQVSQHWKWKEGKSRNCIPVPQPWRGCPALTERRQNKDLTTCSHFYLPRRVHGIARFTLHKPQKETVQVKYSCMSNSLTYAWVGSPHILFMSVGEQGNWTREMYILFSIITCVND